MYLQYALAANKSSCIKHSIRKSVVRRSRKVIISIYLALVMPHLKYCVQFGALQNKWGISKKRKCPTEGHHAGQGAGVCDIG